MLTLRQIERLWQLRAYPRLIDELCTGRAEAVGGIRQLVQGPLAAAALTVIRLSELCQGNHPRVAAMVRYICAGRNADGGFGSAVTTALCLRALAGDRGTGPVVDGALAHLAQLQREDGEWPREANNRFPGDPAVTAFVLLQLAESRVPAARALINSTMDRLCDDLPADGQLQTLRRRVANRIPAAA
ncbi:MAG TPA: hypothetical protein VF624_13500 [Tepidisphaeraceae bacterium]|jgi:hypothetical protein